MTTLEILRTGPLALVEDLGRTGMAHLGVTRSGAADRRSHTLANRLVANPDDRATVEVMFGGFSARVRGGDIDVAVTGADTDPTVNGKPFGTNSIHHVRDGEVISLGSPHAGLRSYLAVRGGVDVDTGAGVAQLRRDVGDRAAATAGRRRAAGRDAHRRIPRTGSGTGGRDRGPAAGTAGDAGTAGRLVRRPRRPGAQRVGGLGPQRPGRDAADRDADALPRSGPPAAVGGRHPRGDPGAAQRAAGHSRPRPSGDRRLSGGRRGDRRRYRQGGADPAGPDGAPALGAAQGLAAELPPLPPHALPVASPHVHSMR